MDPANELWVCTITGHCFDRLLSPEEMESDAVSGHLLCLAICHQVAPQILPHEIFSG